jgi:hypothetical protein
MVFVPLAPCAPNQRNPKVVTFDLFQRGKLVEVKVLVQRIRIKTIKDFAENPVGFRPRQVVEQWLLRFLIKLQVEDRMFRKQHVSRLPVFHSNSSRLSSARPDSLLPFAVRREESRPLIFHSSRLSSLRQQNSRQGRGRPTTAETFGHPRLALGPLSTPLDSRQKQGSVPKKQKYQHSRHHHSHNQHQRMLPLLASRTCSHKNQRMLSHHSWKPQEGHGILLGLENMTAMLQFPHFGSKHCNAGSGNTKGPTRPAIDVGATNDFNIVCTADRVRLVVGTGENNDDVVLEDGGGRWS